MNDFNDLLNDALYTREYFHQEDICRLCWSQEATKELFSRMIFCTVKSPLFFKVQSCIGIDLSEDVSKYHPRKICEKCLLKIEQFNDFKEFCQKTNQKLNSILNGTDSSESKLNADSKFFTDPIKIEKNESNVIDDIDLIDAESLDSVPDSFQNFEENVDETFVNTTESSITTGLESIPAANQCNQKNNTKPSQIRDRKGKRLAGIPVKIRVLKSSEHPENNEKVIIHQMVREENVGELPHTKTTKKSNQWNNNETSHTSTINNERPSTYCSNCFTNFKDNEAYLNHKSEAHGIERDGKFRCFGCSKLFKSRNKRLLHENHSCESLEYGFKCNICGRYLPMRDSFERHLVLHRFNKIVYQRDDDGWIFNCDKCNTKFTKRSMWSRHTLQHRREDNKSIVRKKTASKPEHKPKSKTECKPKKSKKIKNESCNTNERSPTYCTNCVIDLEDKEAYLNHNSEIHGLEKDGRYKCFGCGKLFVHSRARVLHECHCSSLEFGFKCNICGRYLPHRRSYEIHLHHHGLNKVEDQPDGGIFKCDKCDERFTRRTERSKHVLKHKRAVTKEFICEKTASKPEHKPKSKTECKPKKSKKIKNESCNTNERSPTYCTNCVIDLEDKEAYLNHNSEIHGLEKDGRYKCFGCGKLFVHSRARVLHECHCSSLEFGFKCNICGRYLPHRRSYETHLNHHGLNKVEDQPDGGIFKCDKCDERFTRRTERSKHVLKHKRAVTKEFICEICGKAFSHQTYLYVHVQNHKGIKRHKCDICGYGAVQKTSMTIHMRKHTKERPYACELCPQRCVSASNLLAHQRRHAGISRFQCSICNKKFGYKETLRDHIEVKHQRSQVNTCATCGSQYALRRGLQRHMKKKHPDQIQKPKSGSDNNMSDKHRNTLEGVFLGNENGQGISYLNNEEIKFQEVLYPTLDKTGPLCPNNNGQEASYP